MLNKIIDSFHFSQDSFFLTRARNQDIIFCFGFTSCLMVWVTGDPIKRLIESRCQKT